MPLDRKSILATSAVKREEVPAFGGTVLVRGVSAREQEHWWTILDDWNSKGIYAPAGKRGSLVIMGCINEDGSPLFTLEDAEWLGSAAADTDSIDALFSAIQRLSGMTSIEQAAIEKKPEIQKSSCSSGPPTNGSDQTSID